MQKLCTTVVLSSMLFVGNNVGMEQFLKDINLCCGISKEVMYKFRDASLEGECKKFIDENPYVINAWVEPYSGESYPLLHVMVERDDVSAVKALLHAGACVHINTATEKSKHTPLHMTRSKEMALLLLTNGAQLENKDKDGNTPLSHALFCRTKSYHGYFDITDNQEYMKKYDELTEYLLQRGANSNVVNNNGVSLLHRAAYRTSCFVPNYDHYITLLLEFSADTEVKDGNGNTPYELAVQGGTLCKKAVEILRKYHQKSM